MKTNKRSSLKKLPIGIENFTEMRTENFYYVDKTNLIRDLMAGWGKVTLFTRPRRFGKTLNMSMLKAFFEIGGSPSVFEGLNISAETDLCSAYMGKYPVIFISLKGIDGLTFEDARERLRRLIRMEMSRMSFLLESPAIPAAQNALLARFINEQDTPADLTDGLSYLSRLLEMHFGQKVILLIDEYDVPLDKAYQHGYYDQMADLIRSIFGAALKTNDSLHFAVLTGCLRISKESIFTGLNNLKTHSISDPQFDEYFGFTQAEVDQILTDYGFEDRRGDIRRWYDGYRFGSQDIYCPWDVINYLYDLRADSETAPKAYWLNTSGNDMVRGLIDSAADGTTQMEIENLISGKTVFKTLNEHLTHNEISDSIENIWSLLYMTGYLTTAEKPRGDVYALRIPNAEIRQIFMRQVLDWFKTRIRSESKGLTALYGFFESGDAAAIEKALNQLLLDTISFHDARESFYHGFLLALLSTCSDWRVSSNPESGHGRSDIVVERKDRKMGFLAELKEAKDETRLETCCSAALRQIRDKDYTAILRRYQISEIWIYGIAFCHKICRVKAEKLPADARF